MLRLDILKSISSKEACGYDIHKSLADSGQQVEIGRLYKVLIEMLTEGLLGCRWEKSEKGPEKRIYRLTAQGKKELEQDLLNAINTIHSHYGAYLLSLPTKTSIFEGFARMIIPENRKISNIALYANESNPMHQPLLAAIQTKSLAPEICLIQPRQNGLKLNIRNVVPMQGEFDSIPLKERHLDLLIVEGLPVAKVACRAVEEWHRVLRNNGTLVVVAPKTLFLTLKDPLTIGDFIEKIEHQNVGITELVKGETLQQLLEGCFANVQRKEILQMTFLICRELGKPLLPPS